MRTHVSFFLTKHHLARDSVISSVETNLIRKIKTKKTKGRLTNLSSKSLMPKYLSDELVRITLKRGFDRNNCYKRK